jgi:DNA adenine methylase
MNLFNENNIRPVLKWVGGKRELLPNIRKYYSDVNFNRYIEPFVGGMSVYIDVINVRGTEFSKYSYINDINSDLIQLYKNIKINPEGIIDKCKIFEELYHSEGYYYFRDRFNGVTRNGEMVSIFEGIERSSSLILLNRTCFNGLYRINSKGLFNVPEGKYKNPKILDTNNLISLSHILPPTTQITSLEFDQITDIKKGDFVYFDPPYHPLNDTSSFTSYSSVFGKDEQIRLRDYFKYLDNKGVFVLLSNSSSQFIKELYDEFYIEEVYCSRNINSKGSKRGKIPEFLVVGKHLFNTKFR